MKKKGAHSALCAADILDAVGLAGGLADTVVAVAHTAAADLLRALTELELVRFFFSSSRRHTRFSRDWSSDVCSSDLPGTRGRILDRKGKELAVSEDAA